MGRICTFLQRAILSSVMLLPAVVMAQENQPNSQDPELQATTRSDVVLAENTLSALEPAPEQTPTTPTQRSAVPPQTAAPLQDRPRIEGSMIGYIENAVI